MEQEGLPTIWFTLSAADKYWYDLIQFIYGSGILPNFLDELEFAKWRRKLIQENQHNLKSNGHGFVLNVKSMMWGMDTDVYSWKKIWDLSYIQPM
eukprot:15355649-Ditylum_brightwellii.AAC.1